MHEIFMQRCLQIARHGLGLTSPNPLVGSVIVLNDNILSEGYHHRFGGPHAERIAIERVTDKSLLQGSTLYVNLEPCNHYGKTPPCTDLILEHGISKVVIGCTDPNPLVAGKGIERMRSAGVEVISGVLESDSRMLNKRFFVNQLENRPYVVLKWAQSADGFLDRHRMGGGSPNINWITSPILRSLVHKWRTEEDAILVGINTVRCDNPKLNVRLWHGRNPMRIILHGNGDLPSDVNVFKEDGVSRVYSKQPRPASNGFLPEWVHMQEGWDLLKILQDILARGIGSLIVEGGASTLKQFLDSGLWDEARIFTGEILFDAGIPAPPHPEGNGIVTSYGNEKLEVIYRQMHPGWLGETL